MSADNIQYELADRVQGLAAGGIGAMLLLARSTGLIADIDQKLHLLNRHLPYHESDHVLNTAFTSWLVAKNLSTSSCGAMTKSISTRWGPSASPIRRLPAISVGDLIRRMFST